MAGAAVIQWGQGYSSRWQLNLSAASRCTSWQTWKTQELRFIWRLVSRFQKAKTKKCPVGWDSLQGGHVGTLHKPQAQWRETQNTGEPGLWDHLPRKATCLEWSQLKEKLYVLQTAEPEKWGYSSLWSTNSPTTDSRCPIWSHRIWCLICCVLVFLSFCPVFPCYGPLFLYWMGMFTWCHCMLEI